MNSNNLAVSNNITATSLAVVRRVTAAPLRMQGTFIFNADQATVFSRVSEPEQMASWFPLLKGGDLDHAKSCTVGQWDEGSKRTCYTNGMGKLHETIHHWDAPHSYAYEVQNFMMPLENHLALMIVTPITPERSQLVWNQYFDLTGIAMRHMFPTVMLKLMNSGMKKLAGDLGGPGGTMQSVRP